MMNFADKIGAAKLIAVRLERQTDDLLETVVARYGAEASVLVLDVEFIDQLNLLVRRNPETQVWWPIDQDEDNEGDWCDGDFE